MANMNEKNNENENIDYKEEMNKLKEKIENLTNDFLEFQEKIKNTNFNVKNKNSNEEKINNEIIENLQTRQFIENKKDNLFVSKFVSDKWNNYLKEYCDLVTRISSKDELDKKIQTKITKEDLENNPVENIEEFWRFLIMIKPSVDQCKLAKLIKSQNFKENDLETYNKFLIYYYDTFNKVDNYNKFIEIFNKQQIEDNTPDYSNYKGKNLLGEYMDNHGKKLAWLSKKTNIPRSTLESMARNPESMPTVDKAIKICKVLGEEIETIFPLEEQK